jgi:hypothetical protein
MTYLLEKGKDFEEGLRVNQVKSTSRREIDENKYTLNDFCQWDERCKSRRIHCKEEEKFWKGSVAK